MKKGFRLYDKQEKRMIETPALEHLFLSGNGNIINPRHPEILMERYVRMDSTGLLDKNGKEVFEGDILQWTTEEGEVFTLGPVKWREEVAIWAVDIGIGLTCIEPEDLWVPETVYEVVGNIHQNTELLEARHD